MVEKNVCMKSVLENAELKYRIKKFCVYVCMYVCMYVCRPFLVNTITSVKLKILISYLQHM